VAYHKSVQHAFFEGDVSYLRKQYEWRIISGGKSAARRASQELKAADY
jgi:hypothetical protein